MFKKASRRRVFLKIGIMGPSGSGKSYGALKIAEGIADGGPIAAIDTENGSLSLYDNLVPFDVVDMEPPFAPAKYIAAIREAEAAGYKSIVIDSFSHAWRYLLQKKEDLDKRGNGGNRNQFANWGPIKAEMDELKDAILQSRIHVICCMRAKTEYAQEGGKVTKVGMAAIQEPDVEYEFTTVFDIAMDHKAMTSKDRTGMFGGDAFRIDAGTGAKFLRWLDTATEQTVAPAKTEAPPKGRAGDPAPDGKNAFGYVPVRWPLPKMFEEAATEAQLKMHGEKAATRGIGENAIPLVRRVVLAQYGLPDDGTKATASLFTDWLINAGDDAITFAYEAGMESAQVGAE